MSDQHRAAPFDLTEKAYKGLVALEVRSVQHWTDRLFSFSTSRPDTLRFRSGEFVMIGLPAEEKALLRAYSIASPNWAEELSFYSIKVPDGPLTSRLQHIQEGEHILLRPRPTGTLVHDALRPGKRLIMLSTGTGIAPFAAVSRDPETYEKFEHVILTQTCRQANELCYGQSLEREIREDPLIGEMAGDRFTFFTSLTREKHPHEGRITTLIEQNTLFDHIPGGAFNPETDRVMICGSSAMLADLKALCLERGFTEGANNRPAEFVIEKAFAG